MKNINLCFSISLRYNLKRYRFFEIGNDHYYYDDFDSEERLRKFVNESYLKTNRLLLDLIKNTKGAFRVSFAITGVALEQIEQYEPELLESFRTLADTGAVEFLGTTYSNSLASIFSPEEFSSQIKRQSDKVLELFGRRPTTFANTALIYSDEIADEIYKCGYKNIIVENAKHVFGWHSRHQLYGSPVNPRLRLLVRDDALSDIFSFKFSNPHAEGYPYTADKFVADIANTDGEEQFFNILMGYEAFGILNKEESGIFDFLNALPIAAMENNVRFSTPSASAEKQSVAAPISVAIPYAWADEEKTIAPWIGNIMQKEALEKLYNLAPRVHLIKDRGIQIDWIRLQDEKHFFLMQQQLYNQFRGLTDMAYYESAYEAFMNYMNVLSDFILRVKAYFPQNIEDEELNALLQTILNQEEEIKRLKAKLSKKNK